MPDLVDVVVVGGGVLGAAITLGLARRNLRVLLLEAQRLGSGATASGFAWVNATAKAEDEAYFRLNAQGVTHYDRLINESGAERLGVHGGGSLFWTRMDDAEGQERLRRHAQRLRAWDYPVALLNTNELAVLEPNAAPADAVGGDIADKAVLFAPADKWVDAPRLCRFFIEQAQMHKAEVRLNCPATGFTRAADNSISTVETPRGRVATRLLVLAAGIHTPRLAALVTGDPATAARIPVNQEPGLLVETPPLPPDQQCQRILYPPDAYGLHLRPTPGGGLLIGADDTDAWLQRSYQDIATAQSGVNVLPEALWHSLLERAARCLPRLSLAELMANSTPRLCIRPVPADGFPVVGALPDVPGAYVAVTHSGITLGPLLADLLTNEIFTRVPSPLLARYRPYRDFAAP
jgi:glycine/D-amino acid oxidase-like deaminating enzyme